MGVMMFRAVTRHTESWRGRHGRLQLFLVCGHGQRRKYSEGVPGKVRCHPCERLRSGGTNGTTFDTQARVKHWETWDAAVGMPVQHQAPMTQAEITRWCRES